VGPVKRALLILSLGLVVLAATAAVGWFAFESANRRFAEAELTGTGRDVAIVIPRGTSFDGIVARLAQAGHTEASRHHWRWLAWRMAVAGRLKAGEYALAPGTTPRDLLARMARGEVVQHRFTIIEGWNFRDLRTALARDPVLVATIEGRADADVMALVGAEGVPAEGRFLPDTYLFPRGTRDVDVLRRAHRALERALDRAWNARADGLPLASRDELLVLASIVEKETGRVDERREVAGVFTRRLKIGMRLQTDPTVIYGVGAAFDGNLTRRHLETDTPWNTYTRGGLPPTPIAMPGVAALEAAANPRETDALYFVARGDGSHQFSATLAEHNAAVRRWQLGRR
jgi:UPF0755 protein